MPEIESNTYSDKKRNNTKTYLIVTTSILGFLVLPSLPVIMMSPMMFDSTGSDDSIATIILVLCLILYPFIVVLGIAGSWILFSKKKYFLATIFASLPIVDIMVGILAIIYISVFCDGSFVC
ncbi:hypothetical protein [Aquimarina pacifica]|uniref:hypothetical protein n=1 Tax=Aquimarina pacifica TaxID=1296415 RepID=UPI00046E57D1|nr:hypothetical protein [Aquimarina pacifica]